MSPKDQSDAQTNLELQKQFGTIPYVSFLGIRVERRGSELTTVLPFDEKLIGNPTLPALHGGVIGAFLETSALAQITWEDTLNRLPKTIDISFDYLRSGQPRDTYARSIIAKHGRRVANVRVHAWQDDIERPIATAHGHFLLPPPEKS